MLKETPAKKIVRTKSAPRLLLALGMVLVGVGLMVFGLRGVLEDRVYIRTPKMLIKAEIADDEEERVKGLSGRDSLDVDEGMLFIFDTPDEHGIWMRDMKFPIDVVFLDSNKKVIMIEEEVNPDNFPQIYAPEKPTKYIIELHSGTAINLGIKVGQILSW